jgi:hypothetical protein
MIDATVTELEKITAPYGREIKLENVAFENGMRVLRVHIREGNRFTVMDIDANAASKWGEAMSAWAGQVIPQSETQE